LGTLTETLDAIELAKINGYTALSAIARVKLKTQQSRILLLQQMQDKLKLAPLPEQTGLQNTINY
jgi:hypothetical protein